MDSLDCMGKQSKLRKIKTLNNMQYFLYVVDGRTRIRRHDNSYPAFDRVPMLHFLFICQLLRLQVPYVASQPASKRYHKFGS